LEQRPLPLGPVLVHDQPQPEARKQARGSARKQGSKQAHTLPDDWVPTADDETYGIEHAFTREDIRYEAERMRLWAGETQTRSPNWSLRFKRWLLDQIRFRGRARLTRGADYEFSAATKQKYGAQLDELEKRILNGGPRKMRSPPADPNLADIDLLPSEWRKVR
jgi:hypothetical protein